MGPYSWWPRVGPTRVMGTYSESKSRCELGSDTTDCGCREGTTVGDWVETPPALEREWNWGDRFEWGKNNFCGVAPMSMGVIGFWLLLPCLAVAWKEVREVMRATGATKHVELANIP